MAQRTQEIVCRGQETTVENSRVGIGLNGEGWGGELGCKFQGERSQILKFGN